MNSETPKERQIRCMGSIGKPNAPEVAQRVVDALGFSLPDDSSDDFYQAIGQIAYEAYMRGVEDKKINLMEFAFLIERGQFHYLRHTWADDRTIWEGSFCTDEVLILIGGAYELGVMDGAKGKATT